MSYDAQRFLENVFGITPYTDDWYVGLYEAGGFPYDDLAACEITRALFDPIAYSGGFIVNTADILMGPLPLVTVQGIFIVNGLTSNEASYYWDFFTPIDAEVGDYIRFMPGTIQVYS